MEFSNWIYVIHGSRICVYVLTVTCDSVPSSEPEMSHFHALDLLH